MTGMTPLHLGPLHPVEQALTLLLAFGPFVVLGAVVWWRQRTDARGDRVTGPQVKTGTTASPRSRRS
jgi:hypothetical protein